MYMQLVIWINPFSFQQLVKLYSTYDIHISCNMWLNFFSFQNFIENIIILYLPYIWITCTVWINFFYVWDCNNTINVLELTYISVHTDKTETECNYRYKEISLICPLNCKQRSFPLSMYCNFCLQYVLPNYKEYDRSVHLSYPTWK